MYSPICKEQREAIVNKARKGKKKKKARPKKLWLMETFFFWLINLKEIQRNKKGHLFSQDFKGQLLTNMQAFYMSRFLVYTQTGIPFVDLDSDHPRTSKH